ncbi:hypothetical protein NM688_g5763 [Phlebia brevispora]|uniref:Uncharacterized protein n=1 Tax=Phlebia brevispora TaxID=194682 RepID=A0ACC1SQ20_9APHY|nr:hypothetical protein NM688_g5763 [Phlebia brevispora]
MSRPRCTRLHEPPPPRMKSRSSQRTPSPVKRHPSAPPTPTASRAKGKAHTENTRRTVVISQVRDMTGRVTSDIRCKGPYCPTTNVDVRSLSHIVDDVLDAFGFESSLIDILYEKYMCSHSVEQFVELMTDVIPVNEVLFYWDYIEIPEDRRRRIRNVPWVEVEDD